MENEMFDCPRCGQDVYPSEHPEIGCDYQIKIVARVFSNLLAPVSIKKMAPVFYKKRMLVFIFFAKMCAH